MVREGAAMEDELVRQFKHLDSNRDGFLNRKELEAGMRECKIAIPSEKDVDDLFSGIDTDKNGVISQEEFVAFGKKRVEEIREVFDKMDENRNGTLSSSEMRAAITHLGLKVSDKSLQGMMQYLKGTFAQGVSFEGFRDVLLLLPSVQPHAVLEALFYLPLDDAQSEYTVPRDVHVPLQGGLFASLLAKLYAGGIAGSVSRTVTAPIDRVKTVIQAAPPGGVHKGLLETVRDIRTTHGLKAFWRGNGTNCLKIAPETAVKFMAFDYLKKAISQDPGHVTITERFVAGGLAGAASQLTIYPLEVVKTRMAVSPAGTYKNVAHCLQATLAEPAGARGLYRGLTTSLSGIVPYAGIDLMVNSVVREKVAAHYASIEQEPSVVAVLGCGMVSSSTAMLCTYPLNLIRTRLQASGMPGAIAYTSAAHVFRETLAAQGPRGLYAGIIPNLLKVLPATSISYAVFDFIDRSNKTASQQRPPPPDDSEKVMPTSRVSGRQPTLA